jgi:hypothetical protein
MNRELHRSPHHIAGSGKRQSSSSSAFGRETRRRIKIVERKKTRGQALVIVALMTTVLVLAVALAVDGGSMLNKRREAQNGVDGAALAGTRVMLTYYEDMMNKYPNNDVDYVGNPYELNIRQAVDTYAAMNGVVTGTLEAYFVNDDKQLVTVVSGKLKDGVRCGVAQPRGPCQVGENGSVPWTLGAKGIMVKGRAETGSFFMGIVGYNTVGATATATAFMGVGAVTDNVSLVPIGLFTTTLDIENIREGNRYLLIDSTFDAGSGNWGWVNYTADGGSANIAKAWIKCGFNPSVTKAQWPTFCPEYRNASGGWGPTQHFVPVRDPLNPSTYNPEDDPTFVPYIVYGPKWDGWWLQGSSGAVNSNCQDFQDRVDRENDGNGITVLFPIFDERIAGTGGGTRFHVRVIVAFLMKRGDVSCRPEDPPTPTALPPTPVPPTGPGSDGMSPSSSGTRVKWHIEGVAQHIYSTKSSGRHGNLRQSTIHIIFLDN